MLLSQSLSFLVLMRRSQMESSWWQMVAATLPCHPDGL